MDGRLVEAYRRVRDDGGRRTEKVPLFALALKIIPNPPLLMR